MRLMRPIKIRSHQLPIITGDSLLLSELHMRHLNGEDVAKDAKKANPLFQHGCGEMAVFCASSHWNRGIGSGARGGDCTQLDCVLRVGGAGRHGATQRKAAKATPNDAKLSLLVL
jgi:hypothetical protein